MKRWEGRGKRGLTRVLRGAVRHRQDPGPLPEAADLDSILLVRQQNQLGDMLLCTPVFRAFRARAPHARIDLVTGPANHDPVRCCPHLDEVVCYDKQTYLRRVGEAKRFVDRLRGARYDLALVLSTVDFSHTSAWLAWITGARRRAGRPGPGGAGEDVARDLYHWVLPGPLAGRHQTGVNLDAVAPFGIEADRDWTPEMFLGESEARQGQDALVGVLGDASGGGLRVIVHPGAGKRPNRWPAERFGAVARALQRDGHRVAVATGPSETDLFAGVDRGAGEAMPRLPELPLHALAGALRSADLLLANDTGVMHVGAAVGTTTLALFGPTDPRQWCPSAPGVWTLRPPDHRVASLPESAVTAAAREIVAWSTGGAEPATPSPAPAPSAPESVAP